MTTLVSFELEMEHFDWAQVGQYSYSQYNFVDKLSLLRELGALLQDLLEVPHWLEVLETPELKSKGGGVSEVFSSENAWTDCNPYAGRCDVSFHTTCIESLIDTFS